MESKMSGLCAMASERRLKNNGHPASVARLEKGPAFGKISNQESAISDGEDWPTYRHDPARSGSATTAIPADLKRRWRTELGGKLTSVVIADGRLFVASVDDHTVHALDASSGETLWAFTAGGRVDSPPTIHQSAVLFGSADGWVYCLRAEDGELAWRFRAAPEDLRLTAFEQVESVWPVHGSVLVQNDVVYCVAGRSMFIDGGMRLLRLNPETGELLSETVLDEIDPDTGQSLQANVQGLNMPGALPDILSSDGESVFMRSRRFDLAGNRLPKSPNARHLFCPTGFLDDSWMHRSYWLYGETYSSGAGGYFRAGRQDPAGRLLVFDETSVFGYGRKPDYFRWITPLDYRLFATERTPKLLTMEGEEVERGALVGRAGRRGLRQGGTGVAGGVQGQTGQTAEGRPGGRRRAAGQAMQRPPGEAADTARQGRRPAGDVQNQTGQAAEGRPGGGRRAGQAMQRPPGEAADTARRGRRPAGDVQDQTGQAAEGRLGGRRRAAGQAAQGPPGEAAGAAGQGRRFGGGPALPDTRFACECERDVPLHVGAMTLAGDRLFIAGPPDLIDEDDTIWRIGDPSVQAVLAEQDAVLKGKRGSMLHVVSIADAAKLAEHKLDALPVWDGMAAANGRLYIALKDGSVLCLGAN
jgi:hypothetical protein